MLNGAGQLSLPRAAPNLPPFWWLLGGSAPRLARAGPAAPGAAPVP
jgi:hypothetical protein